MFYTIYSCGINWVMSSVNTKSTFLYFGNFYVVSLWLKAKC